jgi:hypothetical protein
VDVNATRKICTSGVIPDASGLPRRQNSVVGRLSPSHFYRFIDGEISGLVAAPHVINFHVDQRCVIVERNKITATLCNGDRVRALVQAPVEDGFHHVLAFQRTHDRGVHYTGPTLSLHPTVVGATLLAAGIYSGLAVLLISGACLFALEVIFSLQRVEALRRFHLR